MKSRKVIACVLLAHVLGCTALGDNEEGADDTSDEPNGTPGNVASGGAGSSGGAAGADNGAGAASAGVGAGGADGTPPAEAECGNDVGVQVSFSPLRRLGQGEYDNAVRDLFEVTGSASPFVPDARTGPFLSNTNTTISELQVEQYRVAAETIAREAVKRPRWLIACAPDKDEACAKSFVSTLGAKVLRRPLTPEQEAGYLDVFNVGNTNVGFIHGLELVLRALLQSPYFLYHVEDSVAISESPTVLAPHELASRLSFLLWGSTPDETLSAAARADELNDTAKIRAQAERLLLDAKSKEGLARFYREWLGMSNVGALEKSAELFPQFDEALKVAMQAETASFVDDLVRNGDGKLRTLLTAPYSFLSGPLYALYGVEAPADLGSPLRVELDNEMRSGILTQAGFLASHAHLDQSSPVQRGVAIRQSILCQDLPPPPPDVNNSPPKVDLNVTTRERFAAHSSSPACAGCHSLIDPVGFAFERYDAIGAYRTEENGVPIDTSGTLTGADADANGTFSGPAELGQRLAESDLAKRCMVKQWYRFAFKREPAVNDSCTTQSLTQAFLASDGNIRELLLELVQSNGFRYGVGEP